MLARVTDRLATLTAEANRLAGSRTGDERLATELAELLMHWLIHGKPKREVVRDPETASAAEKEE